MIWKFPRMARTRRQSLAVAMAATLAGNPSLYAGTITWTGLTDATNWSQSGNWDTSSIPAATSDVVIDPGNVSLDVSGLTSIHTLKVAWLVADPESR